MTDMVAEERETNGNENYEVGYKKPPLHTRFGQPGVPNHGRPKGSKSLKNLLIQALRKTTKDGKGGEKEFYDLLTESIVVNAAKGNAPLVKLIFEYLEGPPPQRHELTQTIYDATRMQELLREIAALMRDFVPAERWEEFGERLQQLDTAPRT
ncbi:MAG: hypothetical protein JW990_21405 [Thermoleophilia bacterium]|nr:hypothetical protein [Thermoleophilia bacterium]